MRTHVPSLLPSHSPSLQSENLILPCTSTSCFIPSFLSLSSVCTLSPCTALSNLYMALSLLEAISSCWALLLSHQSIIFREFISQRLLTSNWICQEWCCLQAENWGTRFLRGLSIQENQASQRAALLFICCKLCCCHCFPFAMDCWEPNQLKILKTVWVLRTTLQKHIWLYHLLLEYYNFPYFNFLSLLFLWFSIFILMWYLCPMLL